MNTYLILKPFPLYKYNAAEYLNFIRRLRDKFPFEKTSDGEDIPGGMSVRADTETEGAPSIGLTAEQVEKLDLLIQQLTDFNVQSRTYDETENRKEVDQLRLDYCSFLLTRINNARKLVKGEKLDAATRLANITKPYAKIAKIPNNQRTELINGLLFDLKKEENAAAIKTLDLTEYMMMLEEFNDQYTALTKQMSASRLVKTQGNVQMIRDEIDDLLDDIHLQAQSWQVCHPTEQSRTFIIEANHLVDEAETAYNQRKTGKTAKEGTGGEETPDVPGGI